MMFPVAIDQGKKGQNRILQRCTCGHERWNKVQDNDDFEAILAIVATQEELQTNAAKRVPQRLAVKGRGRANGRGRKGR
jgi:L-aminopeptidase/D-esterase-like protein